MMNEVLNAIPPMIYIIIILIGFCALFGAAYYAFGSRQPLSDGCENEPDEYVQTISRAWAQSPKPKLHRKA